MRRWLPIVLLLLLPLGVQAAVEVLDFKTPEAEASYNKLIKELRCLVCQNQDLADSNADLAKDLRHKTYLMINEGKSEQEILEYMVDRYGEFVLYRPRLELTTVLLWFGPFLLLVLGVFLVLRTIRRRRGAATATALSDEERVRMERLLAADGDEKNS